MSTTTSPCSRASSRRCSTEPARTSTHRSPRGSPVTTLRWASRPRCTEAEPLLELPGRGQPGGGEQAGDLVEDPELLGHRPAVRVGVDEDRAALPAGDLGGQAGRDGGAAGRAGRSPHRDHPPGGRGGAGYGGPRRAHGRRAERRPDGGGRRVVGRDRVRQRVQVVVGDDRPDADPGGPQPTAVQGRAAVRDRDRPDAVPAEVVDGGPVQAGRVEPEHRDVRLTGGGGGQQVVDVDAALEHDDAGVVAEHPERVGLPGRSRGHDQDERPVGHRVSPGGPRSAPGCRAGRARRRTRSRRRPGPRARAGAGR